MKRQPDFSKNTQAAILLHLSSMERKDVMELKKTPLFYLVIKLLEPSAVPRAYTR